jgi:hypothetical protein
MVHLCCTCLLLIVLFTLISCKKFVQVDTPVGQVVSRAVFADDKTALATLNGLYSKMVASNNMLFNGATTIYTGLSSDELSFPGTTTNQLEIFQNSISSTNSLIANNLWNLAYDHIYHANAILEGLSSSNSVSDSLKTQISSEARFVRALCYFYLSNLFGDIPLINSTSYATNASKPRTPVAQVNSQIVEDLQYARDHLTQSYPVNGRWRPNKWAATSVLSRVYLYMKNWSQAESLASEVINIGTYSLVSNLNNVFLAGSTEAIWQLLPVNPSFNTYEGFNFIPSSATVRPPYLVTASLLNAFEPGDARKTSWLKSNLVSGTTYYYPYKYKVRLNSTITEHYMFVRLAELYLIRAEARTMQSNFNSAQSDLNKIRNRAGLANSNANGQSSLLQAIEQERRVEFMFEWGHRWFDLKRTNRANAILGNKPGWQSTDLLYPIPYSELQLNPFLNQNPGY